MRRRRPAVVVVAYGPTDLLDRALSALGGTFPVVVVDNGSSPAANKVAAVHGASYLDAGANLGFAAAVNRGVQLLDDDVDVLLLNPDAEIGPAEVERLQDALCRSERAACAAPSQRRPGSSSTDRVLWPFPSPLRACLDAVGLGFLPSRRGFVIGSVLLLRAEALLDVGGFDERFFLYQEEADWQLRAQRRGWTSVYEPAVSALHVGGATSGDEAHRARLFERSYELYIRKWYGETAWQVCRIAQLVGSVVRGAVRTGQERHVALARAMRYRRGKDPGAHHRPLRVVQVVCSDAFAGVERYVATLAVELARLGCDVTVVGGARQQMRSTLTPAGVRWHPARGAVEATARLMRLGRADVVHAHMSRAELAASLAKARTRGLVFSTRHFARRRGASVLGRMAAPLIARRLDHELAISDFVAGHVDGRTSVIAPGIARRTERRDARCEPIVLVVQRLEPEKQTELALDAFAASRLSGDRWRLVIAGGGECEAALRRRAGELGIAAACDFLGPQGDVDSLYERAAIFFATRGDEPFGLSVVEAMAHGLPVVAAGGGGHLETVGKVPEAALFPAGDALAASKLLRELAEDPRQRVRYGAALQAVQREHFDSKRFAQLVLASYQSHHR